jgi:hypothetical protein
MNSLVTYRCGGGGGGGLESLCYLIHSKVCTVFYNPSAYSRRKQRLQASSFPPVRLSVQNDATSIRRVFAVFHTWDFYCKMSMYFEIVRKNQPLFIKTHEEL